MLATAQLLLPERSSEIAPLHTVLAVGQHGRLVIGAARWSTVCFLLDEVSTVPGGVGGGSVLAAVRLLIGSVEPEPRDRCDRVCRVIWWFLPEKKGSGHFWV